MSANDTPPRFVVDDMLGKLAKWLRILGYDTLYFSRISDAELLAIANRDSRIVLTRDSGLLQNWRVGPRLLITSALPRQQLKQVVGEFGLDTQRFLMTRCLLCNVQVAPVHKQEVLGKVPAYTYQTHQKFSRCPECGRIYWEGTHRERVQQWLANLEAERDPTNAEHEGE